MMYLGTIMKLKSGKALVFTLDCGMVYIKARENMFVGQQVSFRQADVFVGRKALLLSLPIAALAAAAAIVVLLFATGVFAGLVPSPLDNAVAFVAVDINPSVEFQVDADGKILGVDTLNDDARKLTAGMGLKGLTVNEAVARLIQASVEQGYLDPASGMVMVAGTVNGKNTAVMSDVSRYKVRLQGILQQINNQGSNVFALYIEDPKTKEHADQNGLSIGRELLREFAMKNSIDLTVDDIKNGNVRDLIMKLNCEDPEDLNPSPEPSDEESASPSKSDTPAPSEKEKDTPAPHDDTPKPPSDRNVKASVSGSGVKVSWDKASPSDGFQYYKVVASKTNSSPKYPADGYAKAISEIKTTSCTLSTSTSYEGGDIGGHFVPGQKYYFSVTYVYSDHYVYGDTDSVTWPKPSDPTSTPKPTSTTKPSPEGFSPHMSAAQVDGGVRVSWTKLPEDSVTYGGETYTDFQYYKVVASKSDSSPRYPDNGYADAITSRSTSSKTLHPGDGYNGGDVGEFRAGTSYYFSVTYVFSNGKIYANASSAKMPAAVDPTCEPTCEPTDTPAVFTSPHMSASVNSEGVLHVSWTKINSYNVSYGGKVYTGFKYYKVVASKSPNPVYPSNYINDPHSIGTGSDSYNACSVGLEAGESYYISVTYVFENGKIAANDVRVTIPADDPPPSCSDDPCPSDPCPSEG